MCTCTCTSVRVRVYVHVELHVYMCIYRYVYGTCFGTCTLYRHMYIVHVLKLALFSKFATNKVATVESLQSHFFLTMSHWFSGLPVCFPSQGTKVQIPRGVLMWNGDSPVSDVSLHWWPRCDWSFLWPCLRRASSRTITRPSCRQCDNPTWSHTAFLSQFHTHCRYPFRLHNRQLQSAAGGGALWRACNLTSFSPCLTGPVDYLFASRHKGPRFKSLGGYLCETGILLLAMSCYTMKESLRYF